MKLRHTLFAVVASVALAGSGLARAQMMDHGFHHGEGMEFLEGLNLTDAQKQQVHDIEKSAWAQAKPAMEQLRTLHNQIISQVLTAGTTAEQIQPLLQQVETLRSQLDSARLATGLQLRAVLTPEQLTQAASTHEKLEALHDEEHAVMTGGRQGGQ